MQQFQERTEGKRAWEVLKEKFEGSGSMETVELAESLLTCRMDGSKDPDLFFIKIEDLQRRLKNRGKNYTDDMLKDLIIAKLPRDKYHALITSLSGEMNVTCDRVKERIRMHWRTLIREHETEADESSVQALMSKHGAGEGDKQRVRCFRCNKEGHKSFECQQQRNNQGNGGGGRGNRGGRGGDGIQRNRRFHGNCFRCGKFGHRIEDCRQNEGTEQEDSGNDGSKKKNQQHAANTAATTFWEGDEVIALSAIVLEESSAVVTVEEQNKPRSSWIVDSGCSMHMVKSEEDLSEIKWQRRRVRVADGTILEAVGVGRIKGSVITDGGKNIDISFSDVLLVPDLGRNLLSVARIVERGGEVSFSRNGGFISIKGMRLPLRACNKGDLYELEFISNSQLWKKGRAPVIAQEQDQQAVQHTTMISMGKVEPATLEMENRDCNKEALLNGSGKSDEPEQQERLTWQRVNRQSSRNMIRKKFEDGDKSSSRNSGSRLSRRQWRDRAKLRQAPMAAVANTRGAWGRSQRGSRGSSSKMKGCREWWTKDKPMKSKRGVLNRVGDAELNAASKQSRKPVDKSASVGDHRGKGECKLERAERQQQGTKEERMAWNVVQGYESGRRLKWQPSTSLLTH